MRKVIKNLAKKFDKSRIGYLLPPTYSLLPTPLLNMNIEEFFQQSIGKWFAHRTSHDLAQKKSLEAKSDIVIESLPTNTPEVIQLCEIYQVQPSLVGFSILINWNDTTKLNQKNSGSNILVILPNANNPHEGKFLRSTSNGENIAPGHYKLGTDESLTLICETESVYSEERMWFASPNLRMRVNVVKQGEDFSVTSFTSEIRMGVAPPAAKTKAAN